MAGAADQAAQGSQAGSASGGSRPGVAPPAARRRRALAETAAAVAVLLAVGIRAFVLQTFYIPTPSMVPTLGGRGPDPGAEGVLQLARPAPGRHRFYMMGDNRQFSCDSRFWGPIKGSSIVGRVVSILWHDGHPDLHTF